MITVDSQLAYLFARDLFARVSELEALVRHFEARDAERLELIFQLQESCDTFADAIVEALHGKTLDETYEQAFDRVMRLLRATHVDTH